MKLIHLSDLHLGLRLGEFQMLDDQRYILARIIDIVDGESPDAVMIAGDIYDKSVPPAEAVTLFDDFLFRLAERNIPVFAISGNHDSAERVAFGARLVNRSGIFLSPVFDGHIEPVTLADEYGELDVFMLPFVKPAHVRAAYANAKNEPENESDSESKNEPPAIDSPSDALRAVISRMPIDRSRRNVLVTHQFVTGALRSESEEINVGGADNVDAAVFDCFDYVALGHIHRPQSVGRETVRYCGSPLKYSFSEAGQQKSVTVVELREKGRVDIRTVPLTPRRDLRELRGSYMELTAKDFYEGTATGDYLHITLTDEEDVPEAVGRLRAVYPNLMKLDYDNSRTRAGFSPETAAAERMSPLELFGEFYEKQNGRPMSGEQLAFAAKLIERIWGEPE